MPGYAAVQKAFNDELVNQIQTGSFDAAPVVAATKAAIDTALGGLLTTAEPDAARP